MTYNIIRSKRKTMALCVGRNGEITVRAPLLMPAMTIEKFVASHELWLKKAIKKQLDYQAAHPSLSNEEIKLLKQKAAEVLPGRVEFFSSLTGLKAESVKITSAKTRFGSCSANNNICFSYLLMQYPMTAIDYVVLHELAHTRHHNHSKNFWALVEKYMPDYKARKALLRQ